MTIAGPLTPGNRLLSRFVNRNTIYPNITPFTVRDNATYLSELEAIKKFLDNLPREVDENYRELVDAWRTEADELIEAVSTELDTQTVEIDGKIAAFTQQISEFSEQFEEIQGAINTVSQEAKSARDDANAARDAAELYASQVVAFQDQAVKELAADPASLFRAQLDSMYRVVLPSPGNNIDIMPTIQALYDAGVRVIDLKANDVYLFDSVVFLDRADVRAGLTIYKNGAIALVGENAGRPCTPYAGTPGQKFLFYVNNKRTTASVVPVNESTTATGSYTATVGAGLTIVDNDWRGRNQPVGQLVRVAMVNNSSIKLRSGRTSWISGFYATAGYCDSNAVEDLRVTNPTSLDPAPGIVVQQSNGDALVITAGNVDAKGMVCDLRYTRGAVILAPVGGSMRFTDCRDISVIGAHVEGDERTRLSPPLRIVRSLVSVRDSEFWAPSSAFKSFSTIEVADGTANANATTDLLLDNVIFMNVYRDNSAADELSQPEISIESMNAGSVIRARNTWSAVTTVASTDLWRSGVRVVSADAAIQTALNDGAGIIATGSWDLRRIGGGWKVTPPDTELVAVTAILNAPGVDTSGSTNEVVGTIAAGDYTYRFAMIDGNGVYGNSGASVNVTLSKVGGNAARIIVTSSRRGRIAIWRKGSAQSSPDRYAVFAMGGPKLFLYDTGENINKRPWNRDNVPAIPPSTGSASVDTLKLGTKTVTLS